MRVVAYCLMPNHWHLVVWPERDDAVSVFVHWLCSRHAALYRRASNTKGLGHLYQDRFKCFAVATDDHYYRVIRYVEANAARAGLVAAAAEWMWSSAFERQSGDDTFLSEGPLPLPPGWTQMLDEPLPPDDLVALRTCVRRDRPFGHDSWARSTATALRAERSFRSRGRPGSRNVRIP